jgi:hypothetical protein
MGMRMSVLIVFAMQQAAEAPDVRPVSKLTAVAEVV